MLFILSLRYIFSLTSINFFSHSLTHSLSPINIYNYYNWYQINLSATFFFVFVCKQEITDISCNGYRQLQNNWPAQEKVRFICWMLGWLSKAQIGAYLHRYLQTQIWCWNRKFPQAHNLIRFKLGWRALRFPLGQESLTTRITIPGQRRG